MTLRQRGPGPQRTALLAGWLFADLLLVLFVVNMGSLPSASHMLRPKHTSPPPSSRVLDKPVSFSLNVQPAAIQDSSTRSAAKDQLVAALNARLAARKLKGRQAGVLLVFASGPPDGISQAVATAQSVVGLVRSSVPGFGGVSGKGYWSGSGDNLEFEIFFFSARAS
jgi:hypothetical protein